MKMIREKIKSKLVRLHRQITGYDENFSRVFTEKFHTDLRKLKVVNISQGKEIVDCWVVYGNDRVGLPLLEIKRPFKFSIRKISVLEDRCEVWLTSRAKSFSVEDILFAAASIIEKIEPAIEENEAQIKDNNQNRVKVKQSWDKLHESYQQPPSKV